jgi:serine/threonine protein kinase
MTDPADTESARTQALAALIDDVRIARLAGGFIDNQTLVDAHPELMPELGAELEKLQRIEVARRAAQRPPDAADPTIDMPLPEALLSDLEKPDVQVPGYSILREISRGGQAAVYLATQLSTGRKIALKLMHDGPFASDRAITRFRREVQALAALNHPNIVAIIDTGKTPDGARFIAMNYIAGMNLSDYMKDRHKKDPADPARLLRLFLKICDAVNAAHRLGIIHRDLKPSNIRVDERGEPHILDFGLARTALDHALASPDHAVSVTGEFLGSLPWSSPEQAEGNPDKIDIRTDVYSLGVILYQILTAGRFPYEVVGNIRDILNNILTADPTPPSKILPPPRSDKSKDALPARPLPTINEAIEKIVLKALSKKPENRYRSAGDLGRDIARYLAGQRTAPRETDRRALPAKKPLNTYAVIAAIIGVAGVITLIISTLHIHSDSQTTAHAPTTQTSTAAPTPEIPPTTSPTPSPQSPVAADPSPTSVKPEPRPAISFPPASPVASHGTLAILFKGGTLDVFLNGQRIHQSAGDDLRSIPLTLSPGDQLVLRVNSSFYYRSVRCAFIADNPAASFIEKAATTAIRVSPDPKAPALAFDAPAATIGPHDDRQQTAWSDASLPATAEWIALPDSNTTYDIAFTVPPVSR